MGLVQGFLNCGSLDFSFRMKPGDDAACNPRLIFRWKSFGQFEAGI
jgi:hypothetical protein